MGTLGFASGNSPPQRFTINGDHLIPTNLHQPIKIMRDDLFNFGRIDRLTQYPADGRFVRHTGPRQSQRLDQHLGPMFQPSGYASWFIFPSQLGQNDQGQGIRQPIPDPPPFPLIRELFQMAVQTLYLEFVLPH